MKVIYQAKDGAVFTNARKCKHHEKQIYQISKKRLLFIYVDLIEKLFNLANEEYVDKGNYSRKINHYRQLLENNKHIWDYSKEPLGVTLKQFYTKYQFYSYRFYYFNKSWVTLDLDFTKSVKELVNYTKDFIFYSATLEWFTKHYKENNHSCRYKIIITDMNSGEIKKRYLL